jgi:hypothetical protein
METGQAWRNTDLRRRSLKAQDVRQITQKVVWNGWARAATSGRGVWR